MNTNTNNLCCFCEKPYGKYGNNPTPLKEFPKKCCDVCNIIRVIPARIKSLPLR